MLKRTVLFGPIIILLAAGPANANVIVRGPTLPSVVFVILSIEALLATLLLQNLGFTRPMRIFAAWFAVTSVTFVMFYKYLSSMEAVPFAVKAITGEIWVIILEALVFYCLALTSLFSRRLSDPLKPPQALKVSAIVNIASMLMGFMVTGFHILPRIIK